MLMLRSDGFLNMLVTLFKNFHSTAPDTEHNDLTDVLVIDEGRDCQCAVCEEISKKARPQDDFSGLGKDAIIKVILSEKDYNMTTRGTTVRLPRGGGVPSGRDPSCCAKKKFQKVGWKVKGDTAFRKELEATSVRELLNLDTLVARGRLTEDQKERVQTHLKNEVRQMQRKKQKETEMFDDVTCETEEKDKYTLNHLKEDNERHPLAPVELHKLTGLRLKELEKAWPPRSQTTPPELHCLRLAQFFRGRPKESDSVKFLSKVDDWLKVEAELQFSVSWGMKYGLMKYGLFQEDGDEWALQKLDGSRAEHDTYWENIKQKRKGRLEPEDKELIEKRVKHLSAWVEILQKKAKYDSDRRAAAAGAEGATNADGVEDLSPEERLDMYLLQAAWVDRLEVWRDEYAGVISDTASSIADTVTNYAIDSAAIGKVVSQLKEDSQLNEDSLLKFPLPEIPLYSPYIGLAYAEAKISMLQLRLQLLDDAPSEGAADPLEAARLAVKLDNLKRNSYQFRKKNAADIKERIKLNDSELKTLDELTLKELKKKVKEKDGFWKKYATIEQYAMHPDIYDPGKSQDIFKKGDRTELKRLLDAKKDLDDDEAELSERLSLYKLSKSYDNAISDMTIDEINEYKNRKREALSKCIVNAPDVIRALKEDVQAQLEGDDTATAESVHDQARKVKDAENSLKAQQKQLDELKIDRWFKKEVSEMEMEEMVEMKELLHAHHRPRGEGNEWNLCWSDHPCRREPGSVWRIVEGDRMDEWQAGAVDGEDDDAGEDGRQLKVAMEKMQYLIFKRQDELKVRILEDKKQKANLPEKVGFPQQAELDEIMIRNFERQKKAGVAAGDESTPWGESDEKQLEDLKAKQKKRKEALEANKTQTLIDDARRRLELMGMAIWPDLAKKALGEQTRAQNRLAHAEEDARNNSPGRPVSLAAVTSAVDAARRQLEKCSMAVGTVEPRPEFNFDRIEDDAWLAEIASARDGVDVAATMGAIKAKRELSGEVDERDDDLRELLLLIQLVQKTDEEERTKLDESTGSLEGKNYRVGPKFAS
jgi:hypothetical protein